MYRTKPWNFAFSTQRKTYAYTVVGIGVMAGSKYIGGEQYDRLLVLVVMRVSVNSMSNE